MRGLLLLVLSATLYALPFLLSDHLWWLIFVFPIPLLYTTCTHNISFIHGYVWGCITFALHLSGGMYVIVHMAHDAWPIGVALGIAMVLYQALFPAFLLWCVAHTVHILSVKSPIARVFMWAIALWFFIIWTDWYSMWIFGIKEGYPLMHPLIPLAQKPALLCLLPIVGKQVLTVLFLLVSVSCVLLLWHKSYGTALFFCSTVASWLLFWCGGESEMQMVHWHTKVKSLPYMACSTMNNPIVMIKIVGNQLKKIIAQCPETEIVIMPESAFNVSNFVELPELLQLWNEYCLGKAVHIIFGASRWRGGDYYNSLHWVYNGTLQTCYDKRHAMLLSERLPSWGNHPMLLKMYFNHGPLITISACERIKLSLLEQDSFIPYICSELFFNELPDDIHRNEPIIAVVNDSLFVGSVWSLYVQKLLILLARFKALQWQRDIVYVSYAQSLFIDTHGLLQKMYY